VAAGKTTINGVSILPAENDRTPSPLGRRPIPASADA